MSATSLMRYTAPERPQKITKAARAGQTRGVSRFWEKMTAAKTKRFLTHWRGRSETTTAARRLTRWRCSRGDFHCPTFVPTWPTPRRLIEKRTWFSLSCRLNDYAAIVLHRMGHASRKR